MIHEKRAHNTPALTDFSIIVALTHNFSYRVRRCASAFHYLFCLYIIAFSLISVNKKLMLFQYFDPFMRSSFLAAFIVTIKKASCRGKKDRRSAILTEASPAIVAAEVLNFCVRDGNRCVHSAIITGSFERFDLSKLNIRFLTCLPCL